LLHFTVVSTIRPEGNTARMVAAASVTVPEGMPAAVAPRVVVFEQVEVDGQHLPVLTEMPVGQKPGPTTSGN
jgi:hypothetical protein